MQHAEGVRDKQLRKQLDRVSSRRRCLVLEGPYCEFGDFCSLFWELDREAECEL